jgi:hypothetical protein
MLWNRAGIQASAHNCRMPVVDPDLAPWFVAVGCVLIQINAGDDGVMEKLAVPVSPVVVVEESFELGCIVAYSATLGRYGKRMRSRNPKRRHANLLATQRANYGDDETR